MLFLLKKIIEYKRRESKVKFIYPVLIELNVSLVIVSIIHRPEYNLSISGDVNLLQKFYTFAAILNCCSTV